MDELVTSIVPPILTERIDTVNVSLPSVESSAVGVTVNEPALLVIENDPEEVVKSPLLVTVQ